ncbi:1-acyl-sn-glycerol-3-phosphate acyltransferase [Acidomonas methanolica]|uniref:1-acyl-sn-glycerol-3-phosphate acyltransferase n=1 Tax=Acidomonas methanolica NBRC 104435 TaxID=1231351 RepID=A0A023D3L3_ACIMT|nr:lysophospholipid acyltransferase family protein [Acidomonas methanolica]MBU2653581.1 1-acyl-sn-glycerol-3-phosphate acyltransferase [Acidomonas methanolica]TCS31532.1 lyso-ornithine lipid acyltransferase [Acidomonas methanolica]GAJ28743.1 1-acyl-sn-glycerol-3-phosphate acyltransferase [Acidomonas methanolica NBRC 104435]GBQ52031.1 1-acyl-sn-glycerol-3-phosphate acyltransferase [Acidomonas methanolica]GEK97951.1 hypothetical protein AME01nite_04500 [Acidomonas methanolica NBRC 104435]
MHQTHAQRRSLSEEDGLEPWFRPLVPGQKRRVLRQIRSARRILTVALWALPCIAIQSIFIRSSGTLKIRFARLFWAGVCRILGLKLTVRGTLAGTYRDRKAVERGARPVIFVANHSSWLDIAVLGGVLPTVFVAKSEIADWPLIKTLARLGRTIFVTRQRNNTGRELREMTDRLADGDNLLLFPEGTSTDGTRVLPFLSSFFAIAKPGKAERPADTVAPPPVIIQPVSLVYDALEGLPIGRTRRSIFAWYGDMDLAPHVWQFGQWRSAHATVLLHPPIDPDEFRTRKELANAVHRIVNEGTAALRQDRVTDT